MLIPFPKAVMDPRRYVMTLSLLVINVLAFILFGHLQADSSSSVLDQDISDGLKVTGLLYRQHYRNYPDLNQPDWIQSSQGLGDESLSVVGVVGLKDNQFLNLSVNEDFYGDQVAVSTWKKSVIKFQRALSEQDSSFFGLSVQNAQTFFPWFTYQFSHSGFMHLLVNMIFLIIAGIMIETVIAGEMVLIAYLAGGLGGGFLFLWLQGSSITPMVGASASISSLVSFAWIVERRRNIRFFYFLSPFFGQFGTIYLPTVLLIPFVILGDFTSLLGQPDGLGTGVAYSAHVGGALVGMSLGLLFKQFFVIKRVFVKTTIS